MLSFTYTRQTRPAMMIVGLLLISVPFLIDFFSVSNPTMDVCFIDREHETPPPTIIPLSDGALHNYSVYVMWIAMFILSLLPNERALALFRLTYASIWFHATYILLAALKSLLFDYNCAGRHKFYPNGISGHYCYFLFVALTAPRLAKASLRRNPTVPKGFIAAPTVLLGLFTIGGVGTLYRTYFHGYHSPRQIMFGAALGLLSHASLDMVLFPTLNDYSIGLTMATMLATSLTSIALYFQWWPHDEAGAAISAGHLVFHFALWIALVGTAIMLPRPQAKEA